MTVEFSMQLLSVKRLRVAADSKVILKGVNLEVGSGEVHVLFGPNGSGKSTLLKTLMGLPPYRVLAGKIIFNDVDIKDLPPNERATMGIALAFQNPPSIPIKLDYFARRVAMKFNSNLELLKELNLDGLLPRRLHKGYSGGESKRAELALALLQKPKLLMLDEPDSGVDVDSLKDVAKAINNAMSKGTAILLVTHFGHIAELLRKVDRAHVMLDGEIVYTGGLEDVLGNLKRKGYSFFRKAR